MGCLRANTVTAVGWASGRRRDHTPQWRKLTMLVAARALPLRRGFAARNINIHRASRSTPSRQDGLRILHAGQRLTEHLAVTGGRPAHNGPPRCRATGPRDPRAASAGRRARFSPPRDGPGSRSGSGGSPRCSATVPGALAHLVLFFRPWAGRALLHHEAADAFLAAGAGAAVCSFAAREDDVEARVRAARSALLAVARTRWSPSGARRRASAAASPNRRSARSAQKLAGPAIARRVGASSQLAFCAAEAWSPDLRRGVARRGDDRRRRRRPPAIAYHRQAIADVVGAGTRRADNPIIKRRRAGEPRRCSSGNTRPVGPRSAAPGAKLPGERSRERLRR